MAHTNDRSKTMALYVRDMCNMLESDDYGYRDSNNIYSCSVSICGSSNVDLQYDYGLGSIEMHFSNGYSVTLHRRDRNTYTASVCYGLDTIDNILCRDSSDIDYIIFMYLLYKAYVGVCDMCGEGDDNYVFTYDCEEAINFDDMFYHSISSLHKYFLTFIKSEELEDYKTVGKNGLNVFTFEDSVYGSFIVDYIPYTLGGQKKDLIVFRYNEFDKIYFYYDVLKRDYVVEKNDRVVKYSNMSSIVRDLKYLLRKVNSLSGGSFDSSMCLTYNQLNSTLFRMIYSVLL
jgi:hypothetical protein